MSDNKSTRRELIKATAAAGAGLVMPTVLPGVSHTSFANAPTGSSVTLGFNIPQSGPYADEGKDELRAYVLAVEHLNGEGDGGMLQTFSSKALDGTGILGKKVEYVAGNTHTKPAAARASARIMIEKDGAIMITAGSSPGVAVAVQSLCQEAGIFSWLV
jgi:ABC-type branched-subunit amino acid transport system substrate-binding protein